MNRTLHILSILILLLIGVVTTLHAQTIKGDIYGGGEMAKVDGKTKVDIKSGNIGADVFGGGKGKLKDEDKTVIASADITKNTEVNIIGGTFAFPENGIVNQINHNVYGGGNLACKIGTIEGGNLVAETGNTTVNIYAGLMKAGFMDGTAWGNWKNAVLAQNDNVAQGSVFGGGYGVNTSVMGTATVNVNVVEAKANKAMVDVVGGGYNGYVLNKTMVTVEGVAEIYKIYGGGLGSHGGYDDAPVTARSHANLSAYTMRQTIGSVGEGKDGDGTNVLIKGGKFYNDIFGGGAGLKYVDETTYLNVAEVFGKTNVVVDAPSWIDGDNKFSKNIYGGGALGLVSDDIYVTLKSGEFDGAQVFGGSLGEIEHPDDKAKVGGNTHVLVTKNETTPTPDALKGHLDIYGGCDMAWVDNDDSEKGNTNVKVEYGTFYGSIFGAGKGIPSTDADHLNADHGKVTGNTSVTIDGGADWKMLTLGAPDKYTAETALAANEANGITEGEPGYVREGDYKTPIKVYGGSALGLIDGTLNVHLKSGTLYGEMFGGSLGELGFVEKAKVTTEATISTEAGSNDPETGKPYPLNGLFNIYGGCDMAQIENNTHVNLLHGTFSGNIFGGGKGVRELSTTSAGDEEYQDYGMVIGETSIVLDAPEIVLGVNNDNPVEKVGIYGGGALGMVDGTINPVTLKSGTLYGSIFGGSLGEKGHVVKAMVTGNTAVLTEPSTTNKTTDANDVEIPAILQGIFHIYGGCDMAQVKGNTDVTIQHGTFEGEIYGGGKGLPTEGGESYMDYGCVFGTTNVLYENDNDVEGQGTFNGDIYGGGALGLVRDLLEGERPTGWTNPTYITQVHLKKGDLNGQVFGGGLGEKVNVDKAKVSGNTLVATDSPTQNSDKLGGDINHVYGGGNMAQVDGNTSVKITHGSFSGTIFGGGNGIYEEPGTQAGDEQYPDFGKVTGETYVLIDGPDLKLGKATYYTADDAAAYNAANDLHDADPAVPGSKADPDFKREGDWKEIQSTMSIYGGGALGMVGKSITVEVKSGEIYGAVFAGSKGEKGHVSKALVTTESEKKVTVKTIGSTVNKKSDGTTPADLKGHFKVYGGCDLAMFEGTSEVVINHGTFSGEIYGGGNGLSSADDGGETRYGQVTGTSKVIIDIANEGRFNGDIYGGGALGLVVPTGFNKASYALPAANADAITTVYLSKGEVNGNVFGGSLGEKIAQEKAMVYGNTLVTTAVPADYITDGAGNIEGRIENFFGGGNMASVNGNTKVHVNRGHFNGRIFGGGNGVPSEGVEEYLEFGKVLGSSNVLIDGDATLQLGENVKYTADEANTHNTALSATPGDVNYVQAGDYKKPMKIYGGGALGKVGGTINIAIKNGEHYGEVFGGSLGEKGHPNKALVTGNTNAWAVANKLIDNDPTKPANDAMPLSGDLKFYGGCEMARVEGQSKVTINHGTFTGAIYGGGKGIPTYESEQYIEYGKVVGVAATGADPKDPVIASVVDFDNEKGTFTGNIYGGGALGKIESGLANVKMTAGTVKGNVYGGSYGENERPAKGTAAATLVEMLGGSVLAVADTELKGEMYGGGALANIAGNTEVHLYGGTVGGNIFGGGLGNATTYQEVGGDTKVILGTADYQYASVIEGGSIFGANNINGTPRGRSFVHVRRTVPRSKNKDLSERSKADDGTNDYADSYDVFAVYGGGNLSAYQPSDATYTAEKGIATVLVENCDNSIAYVYGGGNAAPVPATDVKIYGADAINHAFAGGNGKGDGNNGADVGYLGFYSKGNPAPYGSGKASITVYGGTVHNVYGGSNTLGYIRGGTSVSIAKEDSACPLNVGNVFGGGNQADIDCDVTINCECSEGGAILYAGANNADVKGSITLNIHSGTFGQVFCGNNTGGAVKGKLTVNVDETGCWPVMIGELYGGGNLAGYSVYGYEEDADGKTLRDADGHVMLKTSGTQKYEDPEINLISFTRIGKVFGGGYGESAVIYGNTHVNVEPITGKFANWKDSEGKDSDWKGTPSYILNESDEREVNTSEMTIPHGHVGTIGTIFGGGNAGAVYGNTYVNIGLKEKNKHISGNDTDTEEDEAVTITGDVFGGGEKAIVSGDTNVKIGNNN